MTPTVLFGTGFEMGTIPVVSANKHPSATVSNSVYKTGSYSADISFGQWFRVSIDSNPSELYLGCYVRPSGNNADKFFVRLNGTKDVEIRWNSSTQVWEAYVDGSLVQSGTALHSSVQFRNLQAYFKIADVGGRIVLKVDGSTDIDYTGDTLPGGATADIDFVYFYNVSGGDTYVDDLTISTVDYPGDIRYEAKFPTSDVTKEWLRSAGSDNYALVDEKPPSDSDYVYVTTSGNTDLYGLSAITTTNRTFPVVIDWIRAKKDLAVDQIISELISISGGGSYIGVSENLTDTNFIYYDFIHQVNPVTSGVWVAEDIDALRIGQVGL